MVNCFLLYTVSSSVAIFYLWESCGRTSDCNNKSHSELYLQCSMRCSFIGSFLGSAGEDAERTSSWYSPKADEKTHVECLALSLADSKCPFSSQCPNYFKAIAWWGRIRATPRFPSHEQMELSHSLTHAGINFTKTWLPFWKQTLDTDLEIDPMVFLHGCSIWPVRQGLMHLH